jgi:CHAD domain-containing protein
MTLKELMDDPRSATLHSISRRTQGPAEPVKARPAHLHAKMSPEDAFRITLSDCLAQMTANAATVRAGRSVEGLHQLRVGFRRLEVALGAFATEFEKQWLEELRSRAKILSSRLAPARDLDVFIGERLDRTVEAGDRELLAPLRARAESQRDIAWKQAADCVAGTDFAQFLDDVAALAQSRLPLARDPRLPRVAARILERQEKRAIKRGRKARNRDEADLHRLRIALKKLRYTAEFFATLYPKKKVRHYIKKVRRLQEHLGEINDIAHVRTTLSALQDKSETDNGDLRFAAGMVAGWYRARRPLLAKKALKRWDKFRKLKPFWA